MGEELSTKFKACTELYEGHVGTIVSIGETQAPLPPVFILGGRGYYETASLWAFSYEVLSHDLVISQR